jgi:putative transposase
MAYLARQDYFDDGATFHVTWQCHNKSWFLKDNEQKQIYYDLLLKYKDRYGVSIYSYCLMSNHTHLTGVAKTRDGLSSLMRTVNSQFSRKINKAKGRRGQVIMDRFSSPVIESDDDLIKVMVYIDLNPNRAKMVSHPANYRWCSYRYYAYGECDPLITPSPSYLELGRTDEERRSVYRKMVKAVIEEDEMKGKNYSKTYCIGNPEWVKKRYKYLRDLQRAKKQAYLARRRKFLSGTSPPL